MAMIRRPHFWMKCTYFLFFSCYGIFIVYLNLHYKQIGLSAEQIGVLSALFPLIGLFANPIWGILADHAADRRRLLSGLLLGSGVAFGALYFLGEFGLIFLVIAIYSLCYSPVIPLMDSLTLGTLAQLGGDYGRIRVWGSLGFVFPALLFWGIFKWQNDLRWIFPLFVLFVSGTALVLRRFPGYSRSSGPALPFSALRLLRDPMFVVFLMSGFLQKLSMSGYYSFFSIYLDSLSVPASYMGIIWAIGPIAEITALFFVGKYLARWGIKRILLVCHASTVLRLGILSLGPPVGVILGGQLLHALNFGAFHAADMNYLSSRANEANRSSVQMLYALVCFQVSSIIGHATAGVIVERLGLFALYRISAGVALLALILFGLFFRDGQYRQEASGE